MAKNGKILSVSEIIDLLGGNTVVAEICGFKDNLSARGGDMKRRESIHVRYWPAILEAAQRAGFGAQITPVSLIEAHVGHKLKV